jgi:hypothetical protein
MGLPAGILSYILYGDSLIHFVSMADDQDRLFPTHPDYECWVSFHLDQVFFNQIGQL